MSRRPTARQRARPSSSGAGSPSLAGLGIAGLDRRRLGWIAAGVVAAWVLVSVAGQVSEAASATARVDAQRAANETLRATVSGLEAELSTIGDARWYLQQARAYQLGGRGERAFRIAPGAPSLPPDAPGSEATQLGKTTVTKTPLESWLEVLFGPAPGSGG